MEWVTVWGEEWGREWGEEWGKPWVQKWGPRWEQGWVQGWGTQWAKKWGQTSPPCKCGPRAERHNQQSKSDRPRSRRSSRCHHPCSRCHEHYCHSRGCRRHMGAAWGTQWVSWWGQAWGKQ